jgi:hypothetical protein
LTEGAAAARPLVVEIQRAWAGGRQGVEVRLVLGANGAVRIVEVEPGALERVGEHLGSDEYPVYATDGKPVTPADGKAYLEAVSNRLSYGSRLWATEPFEMDEAAALSVSKTETS